MMRLSAVSLSTRSADLPVIAFDGQSFAVDSPSVVSAARRRGNFTMSRNDHRGMTLIEVLIATALTLLIMLALAQGFKTMSEGVTAGRARLTGSDQLRSLSGLLRSDLNGLTVNTNTLPQSYQSANGYFMYYDGPLSDSTAMLFNYNPAGAEIEDKISASRWSDIDDVLMFTAKARDGEWFRGRVPLALLKIHQYNTTGSSSAIVEDDYFTEVTVASEYAEVAWFMRPLNDLGSIDIAESGGSGYGAIPPSNPVLDAAPVVDRTGDGIPDSDGMPDRIALCRRVLLIRPDLNITPPSGMSIPSDPQVGARPMPVSVGSTDSFRYHMRFAYQRCDLSVRPFYDSVRDSLVLKTNSLADLQLPENRFAHYVAPSGDNTASMPVLALTNESDSTGGYLKMTNLAYGNVTQDDGGSPTAIDYGTLQPFDRGFIPAAFFRTSLSRNTAGALISLPTLEEIVASNVVGFDVRGFDATAQQFAAPGADGGWGIFGVDDDSNGTTDDRSEAGWPQTDDLIVGPGDPGYALMILQFEGSTPVVANSGTFVDLCWGRRVVNQINNFSQTVTMTGGLPGMAHFKKDWELVIKMQANFWSSALSGFAPLSMGTTVLPTAAMIRSGRFNTTTNVYQPTFDTFTDYYESDGNRQSFGMSANGLVRFGLAASASNLLPDAGVDGLDDDGNGATDEEGERETSPPFAYKMPSIQIRFRIQDVTAGTLQELSIAHDLTGN
ncbi:MAG: hypothetical protein FJ308_12500 [Planctomycetes bacterium]|nr:hypothetical protein [Planctomycetota bacterium]